MKPAGPARPASSTPAGISAADLPDWLASRPLLHLPKSVAADCYRRRGGGAAFAPGGSQYFRPTPFAYMEAAAARTAAATVANNDNGPAKRRRRSVHGRSQDGHVLLRARPNAGVCYAVTRTR